MRTLFVVACIVALSAGAVESLPPGIVRFKDAAKIKSWDAWSDHLKRKPPADFLQREKPCVTWKKLCRLESGLPPAGLLKTRPTRDIASSSWSIGCETMDRDYADWNGYKQYLTLLGAKHARFFSGWAKTEQEKGVYDFTWLDPQIRESAAMGVKPWVCLSYGNPVWGSDFRLGMRVKQLTDNPAAFDAWIRYCKAVVSRYKDVCDTWEIWNEPFHQAQEYAEMVYRTATAIHEVQSNAVCIVTAISFDRDARRDDYTVVLERLKKENSLNLVKWWAYHPYRAHLEQSYAAVAEPLRARVKAYSSDYDILQGEVGCPAQLEYAHALSGIEWTEYAKAKWDLRHAMGDAARRIPSNVFTMIDLQYTFMLQSFGLLRANSLKEVVYRRPSFYAMQHVFSFFDDEVLACGVSMQQVNGKELTVAKFTRHAMPLYVMWFSGARPSDVLAYERGSVVLESVPYCQDAVWVDLLTGKVGKLSPDFFEVQGAKTLVKELPLWDSPVMIFTSNQIPRVLSCSRPCK